MKLFKIAALAILISMSGCKEYDNTIVGRTTEQQGRWVYDSLTNSTHLQEDSVYIVSPTWRQAFHYVKQQGSLWLFWLSIIGGIAIAVIIIVVANNSGKGIKPVDMGAAAIFLIIGIVLAASTVEWSKWNRNQYINKSQYEELIQRDGNLKSFWDTIK